MRSHQDILHDQQASEEEIRSLPQRDAILHPNCPKDLWLDLAPRYGLEAVISPLYLLLLLDSPDAWYAIESKHVETWLRRGIQERAYLMEWAQSWAADCLWHVFPSWQAAYPLDTSAQDAIVRREKYGRSRGDLALYRRWKQAMWDVFHPSDTGKLHILHTAITYEDVAAATRFAANATKSFERERLWQWRRMVSYLRGETGDRLSITPP